MTGLDVWRGNGLGRCHVCTRLIWPWQQIDVLTTSVAGTDPPLNTIEVLHSPCFELFMQAVRRSGGQAANPGLRFKVVDGQWIVQR